MTVGTVLSPAVFSGEGDVSAPLKLVAFGKNSRTSGGPMGIWVEIVASGPFSIHPPKTTWRKTPATAPVAIAGRPSGKIVGTETRRNPFVYSIFPPIPIVITTAPMASVKGSESLPLNAKRTAPATPRSRVLAQGATVSSAGGISHMRSMLAFLGSPPSSALPTPSAIAPWGCSDAAEGSSGEG